MKLSMAGYSKEKRWLVFNAMISDIRFWIALFFVIRLFGITDAPIEMGHNWRQSLTNMIARNFLQIDPNPLFPRIDMAGNKTGIIGTEFPLFNYLIYFAAMVFDFSHWHGRLINLVVSSFGMLYFYRLTARICNSQVAFYATMLLLASIWFSFSRKIMPDTFSVSLVIIGLYYGYNYLRNGPWLNLVLFGFFTTLGVLCKIPALSLLAVLALVPFVRQVPQWRRWLLVATAVVGMGLIAAWYFYWVPHLVDTYQFPLYFPKGLVEGIREIIPLWPEYLERFYFSAHHAYTALPLLALGVYSIIKTGVRNLCIGTLLVVLTFVVFTLKTGVVFPLHNYYIMPLVPVMALVAGWGISIIPAKFRYVALAVVMIEGIANQQHDFIIKDSEKHKLKLEAIMDQHVPKDALIVINGGPSPQEIYFANRRGWTLDPTEIESARLDSLSREGAQYLVINHHRQEEKFSMPALYSGADYSVFNLNQIH